jgi:hypothetical protein
LQILNGLFLKELWLDEVSGTFIEQSSSKVL